MSKRTTAEIGCGVSDQHDMQLVEDCRFCFFGLLTEILGILGRVAYHWKVVLHAPDSQIFSHKMENKCFAIV